ncbi:MAG: hypothetical protein CBC01_01830 [Betaproteobacteria bacterium TMED41]|nr:MAG: hypothetical protein CBC01_01830 [Betaproteobacteria bacterium TMED41]
MLQINITLLEYLNNEKKNTHVKIAIIGSGIAGVCIARALARLDKFSFDGQISETQDNFFHKVENITIFEKANSLDEALKKSASGNPIGIIHPIISKRSFATEWTEQGIFTTIKWVKELNLGSQFYDFCGVLHLPRNKEQSLDWKKLENYQSTKSELLTKENLLKEFKYLKSEVNAMWSSHCGWISPKEFVKAAIIETKQNLGKRFKMIFNSNLQLQQLKEYKFIDQKYSLKSFDSVVIATGFGSPNLINQKTLKKREQDKRFQKNDINEQGLTSNKPFLELVNGQMTGIQIDCSNTINIKSVICKSGYLTPVINGFIYSGASYETVKKPHDFTNVKNRTENIKRLSNLICPKYFKTDFETQLTFDRVSTRCVSKDKLPIVGLIMGGNQKIYALTALGSRGLSWGPLAAENLAKEILLDGRIKKSIISKHILPSRFKI